MGQDTPAGWAYESAFGRLQWNGYSQPSMEQAINNFQAGAYVNKQEPITICGPCQFHMKGEIKSILSRFHPNF